MAYTVDNAEEQKVLSFDIRSEIPDDMQIYKCPECGKLLFKMDGKPTFWEGPCNKCTKLNKKLTLVRLKFLQ